MKTHTPTLQELFAGYTALVETSQTLEAIVQYYADDIVQHENTETIIEGKATLLAHEKANLAKVNSLDIGIYNAIVDEQKQIVWGEMKIIFEDKKARTNKLTEAFFQQWEAGKIKEIKFYYKGFS